MKQIDLQGNVWNCSVSNIEPPISSYGSVNYDELVKVMKRFKKCPNFDELIKDNNKKNKEISRLNNIINDLEEYLNNEINNISLQVPYSCNPTLGQSIYQNVLEKLKELKEGKK